MNWTDEIFKAVTSLLILGTVGWLGDRARKGKADGPPKGKPEPKLGWHGFHGMEAFARWAQEAPEGEERERRERLRRAAYDVGSDVRDRKIREADGPAELKRRIPGFEDRIYEGAFQAGMFESMW